MKKSNLIKVFSILLIGIMLLVFSSNVYAAENNTFLDLTNNYASGTGNNNNGNTNTNVNTGNTNATNTGNTNTSNTNVANTNTNVNVNRNTSNSSIYNNTNLPQTGIEDSIPVALLVVVFGISAVYAYKKIREYKNI